MVAFSFRISPACMNPSESIRIRRRTGNSSQVTDGAALVLLARRSAAHRLNLPILARFVSFAVAGVEPEIMGVGPTVAIPRALGKA